MVSSDGQTRPIVFTYFRAISPIEYFRTRPEMIAVSRIAVPDAESQLKRNTAGSGVGLATTGAMRSTILSSPGIGMLGAEIPLSNAFTCGVPHANTITVRITHGRIATRKSALLSS